MPKYFHELKIEEMFEHHDHTYMMADDNRAYVNGTKQREIIEDKIKYSKEYSSYYTINNINYA